jgi:hypothetical protein
VHYCDGPDGASAFGHPRGGRGASFGLTPHETVIRRAFAAVAAGNQEDGRTADGRRDEGAQRPIQGGKESGHGRSVSGFLDCQEDGDAGSNRETAMIPRPAGLHVQVIPRPKRPYRSNSGPSLLAFRISVKKSRLGNTQMIRWIKSICMRRPSH